eukprot:6122287-Heterocapsa_arctica.AAC.1
MQSRGPAGAARRPVGLHEPIRRAAGQRPPSCTTAGTSSTAFPSRGGTGRVPMGLGSRAPPGEGMRPEPLRGCGPEPGPAPDADDPRGSKHARWSELGRKAT